MPERVRRASPKPVRRTRSLESIGLFDSAGRDAARVEMDTVGRALAKEFPVENAGETVRLIAMREYGLRELRPAMVVLLAIVGDVMRLVVGHGMSWTVGGLVVGLAASIGVLRLLQELSFGVTPTDPFVLAAVSLLLLVVAFAASYLPAQACAGRRSGRGAPQSVTRLASLLTLDIGSR